MARLKLLVNGTPYEIDVDPDRTLLSVLRNELGLTGSKYGCGEGQCGACMVLVGASPRPSCITRTEDAAGQEITTVEGIEQNGRLHPLQEAFLEADAFQCGYCAPGMVISGLALLKEHPTPTRSEIVSFMERNVCRCGTYSRIITAIQRAADIGGTR